MKDDALDALLTRISEKTAALRDAAAAPREAERQLLADLAAAAARLRADATAVGEALDRITGPPAGPVGDARKEP